MREQWTLGETLGFLSFQNLVQIGPKNGAISKEIQRKPSQNNENLKTRVGGFATYLLESADINTVDTSHDSRQFN